MGPKFAQASTTATCRGSRAKAGPRRYVRSESRSRFSQFAFEASAQDQPPLQGPRGEAVPTRNTQRARPGRGRGHRAVGQVFEERVAHPLPRRSLARIGTPAASSTRRLASVAGEARRSMFPGFTPCSISHLMNRTASFARAVEVSGRVELVCLDRDDNGDRLGRVGVDLVHGCRSRMLSRSRNGPQTAGHRNRPRRTGNGFRLEPGCP